MPSFWLTVPGSGGGGGGSDIIVSDEGVQLTAAVTSLDFTGAQQATAVGNAVTINVPGAIADDIANRPAADDANNGELFYSTDTDVLYISDGSTWTQVTLLAASITDFDEAAQDAVGGILAATTTITPTYDDATPDITFDVNTGSIGPTELASTAVTPASYGSATQVATFTVDADGRLTAAADATIPTDGWVEDSATWTFASATTFTVTGDRTAEFTKGTRLRFTQTTVKYGAVALSAHAAGTTTVTLIVNTDYTLVSAAITDPAYSYAANPQGYPGWFTYAPTIAGFSADPTSTAYRWSVHGNTCFMVHRQGVAGTSNATTLNISLPVVPVATSSFLWQSATDNGTVLGTPGGVSVSPGSGGTAIYNKTMTALFGWTASGSKRADCSFYYEF